jgi:hypothetical protein
MPDVTIAPSDEACQAIVDRINAGTTYTLPVPATYGRVIFADMETITGFSCDVVHLSEQQLNETLDAEDSRPAAGNDRRQNADLPADISAVEHVPKSKSASHRLAMRRR